MQFIAVDSIQLSTILLPISCISLSIEPNHESSQNALKVCCTFASYWPHFQEAHKLKRDPASGIYRCRYANTKPNRQHKRKRSSHHSRPIASQLTPSQCLQKKSSTTYFLSSPVLLCRLKGHGAVPFSGTLTIPKLLSMSKSTFNAFRHLRKGIGEVASLNPTPGSSLAACF